MYNRFINQKLTKIKEVDLALSNIFQKQDVMRRVCYSLTPIFIYSIIIYGYKPILQVLVSFIAGIAVEYIFEKHRKKKVSEAVLVTCFLYGLSLPPNVPLWINVIGIAFAVFIAKAVFGGFGRNVYNPAITGRLFIYMSFPLALTTQYWLNLSPIGNLLNIGNVIASTDALAIATPLASLAEGNSPPLLGLFLGLRTGSIGEGSIFLILGAAIYLIYTKTADWRPMVSTLITSIVLLTGLYAMGFAPNIEVCTFSGGVSYVLAHLMSGALLYMIVFMTTDPITGPNNKLSKWYYGIIIGATTVLIRLFSGFPEGVSFGIMIGNTFACLIDEFIAQHTSAKKAKKAKLTATTTSIITLTHDKEVK